MAKKPVTKKTESDDHRGVVVGWTHNDLGSSIDLRIQSTVSKAALDDNRIDSHHFLMTRSQALMLAKFLLDTTGQTLPPKVMPPLWRRLTGARNK
ncbi:MAG TPA: hypothetical protein VGN36_08790 [Sphingorhabdus sp.]|jgi:hypothetical protein|nr:hypothetical protein [Sphingorhabdus sp.]